MTGFQREVLRQIKDGIDRAKLLDVHVEYPRGALIDGEWVPWPFDMLDSPIVRLANNTSEGDEHANR